MKTRKLGIALCVVFSCLTLPAMAGGSSDENGRTGFSAKALKIGIDVDKTKIDIDLPFASEANNSNISKGYAAFEGVMTNSFDHFTFTVENTRTPLPIQVAKGWTALHNVMVGSLKQLEVTMDYHVCNAPTPTPQVSASAELPAEDASHETASDLSRGYAAFKGVMTNSFDHFTFTVENTRTPLPTQVAKGWAALHNVMMGAVEQLEVTMDYHVCPTPPTPTDDVPKDQTLTIYSSAESEAGTQTQTTSNEAP